MREIRVTGALPSHLFIGTSALAAYSIDNIVDLLLGISKVVYSLRFGYGQALTNIRKKINLHTGPAW